jgi:hypothetical protein
VLRPALGRTGQTLNADSPERLVEFSGQAEVEAEAAEADDPR